MYQYSCLAVPPPLRLFEQNTTPFLFFWVTFAYTPLGAKRGKRAGSPNKPQNTVFTGIIYYLGQASNPRSQRQKNLRWNSPHLTRYPQWLNLFDLISWYS